MNRSIIADGSSDEIRALTGHRHLSSHPAPITDLMPVEVTEESGGYHRISTWWRLSGYCAPAE